MGNRFKIYNNNLMFGLFFVFYNSKSKIFLCRGSKVII